MENRQDFFQGLKSVTIKALYKRTNTACVKTRTIMRANRLQNLIRSARDRSDVFFLGIVFVVITLSSISPLMSGDRLNFNDDFFQYASRHESVRKSIIEHRAFPFRAYWFGGGYPTLGDPEDPTLNPLVLFSIVFGSVMGIKLIGYLAILIGGLSTYALGRYVLGYTKWGALFSGLVFGLSLFVPLRLQDGNPNEVYAAFLPLCILLLGLACQGKKAALIILPFVFYTMLSDGKLIALMAIFYIIMLCILQLIPAFNTFGLKKSNIRPVKILILVLSVTLLAGMMRFLPIIELMSAKGGIWKAKLFFHPENYGSGSVLAYTFERLWQELVCWEGREGLITLGWIPVILFSINLFVFWKKALPWAINLVLFGWLLIAYNAPFDLLKLLWNLPIFNAVYRPDKYFSFQVAFTIALVSGQFFWLLKKLPYKWLEGLCAVILILASVCFLYPRMERIQRDTYNLKTPDEFLVSEKEFFNVKGLELDRNRKDPFRSVAYFNLLKNTGTIDWYTGVPIAENAIPRYFIDKENNHNPNPTYQGETFFINEQSSQHKENTAKSLLRPNSIKVQIAIKTPSVIVINQNYHSDWRTDRGRLFNANGLIGLQFPQAGSYTVCLRYIPLGFYMGLAISVLSLVLLIFACRNSWVFLTKTRGAGS